MIKDEMILSLWQMLTDEEKTEVLKKLEERIGKGTKDNPNNKLP